MNIIRHDPEQASPNMTPIFVGEVATQSLVGEIDATHLRMTSVTFRDGARNRPHRHSCDQVLVITSGRGIVATADELREVVAGDVVVIPAGELHWHGAAAGDTLTHLSIVTPHETTIEAGDGDNEPVDSVAWMGARR